MSIAILKSWYKHNVTIWTKDPALIRQDGNRAEVRIIICSRFREKAGAPVLYQEFDGTFRLVYEDDGWRLDDSTITGIDSTKHYE
jgi:hypothetical protein